MYSNFSVRPFVCTYLLGRYFNAYNEIYNQNRMQKYDLALEKYWITQSGYFRLATKFALGTGITDGKLIYCHGVSEGNVDKKISTLDYNNRAVYDCLNNPCTDNFGSPNCNLPPIKFDDTTRPHKIT